MRSWPSSGHRRRTRTTPNARFGQRSRSATGREHEARLELRVAVATGEALVKLDADAALGEGMAAGDVVNTAARLQADAPVNGILVDGTTFRITERVIEYRGAQPVVAKGKHDPVQVWEVVEARSRLGVDVIQSGSPLVGRVREMDLLCGALDRARSQHETSSSRSSVSRASARAGSCTSSSTS